MMQTIPLYAFHCNKKVDMAAYMFYKFVHAQIFNENHTGSAEDDA